MLQRSYRSTLWLVHWRWLLLAAGLLLVGLSAFYATRVQFDRSIENMFAASNPLLPPYQRLKERFGGNEIVLAVYRDPDLLAADGSGLKRLQSISRRVEAIGGVRGVLSLAALNGALEKLFRPHKALQLFGAGKQTTPPLLDASSPLAKAFLEQFEGYTHSADRETAALVCMLEPPGPKAPDRQKTVDSLREVMTDLPEPLDDGLLAGEPVMITDGFRYVEQDGRRLATWTVLLLIVVLAYCFCPLRWSLAVTAATLVAAVRWDNGWAALAVLAACVLAGLRPLRWVILPVCVVQGANLATRALLALCGWRLSMVSSMLTAVITVVAVAATIQVIVRFRSEATRRGTGEGRPPLARALLLVAAPLVWACLTDALGFASLMLSQVGPVRDFGLMTALGALLTPLVIALFAPAVLLLNDRSDRAEFEAADSPLERWLQSSLGFVERYRRAVLAVLGLGSAVLAIGIARLDVETDFTRNFRADSPIVQSYQAIESQFGGAGVWDVMLPAPPLLTQDYLNRVDKLQQELRRLQSNDGSKRALSKVISLADALLATGRHPVLGRFPVEARAQGMAAALPVFTAAMRTSEPDAQGRYYLRVMLRAYERQPAASKRQLIADVRTIVARHFGSGDAPDAARGEVTGIFILLTYLISSLLSDQWLCFAVATVGILVMLSAALGGLRLGLLAMIPNIAPILGVLGVMGWSGERMNMGAAMTAAVSMGISIDATIHYLFDYRRARLAAADCRSALARAHHTVGRAVVLSTLALILGFAALTVSRFVPTASFGFLVSFAMLGALLGNLLVLPALLLTFDQDGGAEVDA